MTRALVTPKCAACVTSQKGGCIMPIISRKNHITVFLFSQKERPGIASGSSCMNCVNYWSREIARPKQAFPTGALRPVRVSDR